MNQREYCEAQGIPLKAFGNWRARFKAEPQPPSPKLLYRRRSLSHTLSHGVSHRLSHMTNGSPMSGPIVPPAREGRRRQFSEGDKRRIVEEAVRPGASLSEVARGYPPRREPALVGAGFSPLRYARADRRQRRAGQRGPEAGNNSPAA